MYIISTLVYMLHDNDHKRAAHKDANIKKLIPSVISECALSATGTGVCMPPEALRALGTIVGTTQDILEVAKKQTKCATEKYVVSTLATQLEEILGKQQVGGILAYSYKIDGPLDTTLLSNIHIDSVMRQWTFKFSKFYPWSFNMRNYKNYSFKDGFVSATPDTLATVAWTDLATKHNCGGCIINSDRYQGQGTHWMALFVDSRDRVPTVEFFNSSGNNPQPEFVNWMVKTDQCLKELGLKPRLINVCRRRHQQTVTECGVYALFYVWARLNGINPQYFMDSPVDDQLMFEFRHHLFVSPSGTFDWAEFISRVNVKWE